MDIIQIIRYTTKRQERFDTSLPLRFALCAVELADGAANVHRALAADSDGALHALATSDALRLVEHSIHCGKEELVDCEQRSGDAEHEDGGADDVGRVETDAEAGVDGVEDGERGADEDEAGENGCDDTVATGVDALAGDAADEKRDGEEGDEHDGASADDNGREDGGEGDKGGEGDGEVGGDGDGKHGRFPFFLIRCCVRSFLLMTIYQCRERKSSDKAENT